MNFKSLRELLFIFTSWWNPVTENNNRLRLYHAALSFLGTDVTPKDEVPDDYACAETIWTLLSLVDPNAFGITKQISTYYFYKALKESTKFQKVDAPLEGDLCISPTGFVSHKSKIKSGHMGIVMENRKIGANDSFSGKFINDRYTIESWKKHWVDNGYKMDFFRVL